jgi:hypothetical protein
MVDPHTFSILCSLSDQCAVDVLLNETLSSTGYCCISSAGPDPKCQYPVPGPCLLQTSVGFSYHLFVGTVLEFVWRDWGEP